MKSKQTLKHCPSIPNRLLYFGIKVFFIRIHRSGSFSLSPSHSSIAIPCSFEKKEVIVFSKLFENAWIGLGSLKKRRQREKEKRQIKMYFVRGTAKNDEELALAESISARSQLCVYIIFCRIKRLLRILT